MHECKNSVEKKIYMVVLTIFDWFRMRDKTLIIPMLAGFTGLLRKNENSEKTNLYCIQDFLHL